MATDLFTKRIRPSSWQCSTQQRPVLHVIVPQLLMRFALQKATNVRQFSWTWIIVITDSFQVAVEIALLD